MDSIWYHVIWFFFVFFLMFFIYFLLLTRKLKQKKQTIGEFSYLIHRFSLDTKKVNWNRLKVGVSVINAVIISFVSNFIMLIPLDMMWRLMIGFVLLFALIYALYEIYGRILQKKYGKE